MLSISLSSSAAVMGRKVLFFPVELNFEAYRKTFQYPGFFRGFANAFSQTGTGVVIGLFMLSICAYPLSKTKLKGRNVLLGFIIFTMFFTRTLIPTYMLVKGLKIMDSIWAIVLPFCISPYYLLLVMTFFKTIPVSIEESAQIDGLNPIQILFRIVLPNSKPILATMFMFLFVDYWNNWFNSMIYLDSPAKYPIMLIVRNIVTGTGVPNEAAGASNIAASSLQSSAILVSLIPVMAIFPFAQKFFVKGIMLGAIKG